MSSRPGTERVNALYQIGTRMIPIDPGLYSNERLNADRPDKDYQKILDIHRKLNIPRLEWKNIKIKNIFACMNLRTTTDNIWSEQLLYNQTIKPFFTNREREIVWRTKMHAYKWNTWIASTNPSNIQRQHCLLCNTGDDTIEHLLTQCDIVRQVWIKVSDVFNAKTTRNFMLDDNIIKFNKPPDGENLETWLIPVKTVNIVKSNLLFWRHTLFWSQATLYDAEAWIQSIVDAAEDDIKDFIKNLSEMRTSEQLRRYYIRQ